MTTGTALMEREQNPFVDPSNQSRRAEQPEQAAPPSLEETDNMMRQETPSRASILVVDDENGPRQALRMLLKEDHEVTLASSVEEARGILRAQLVDLVITDLRMPGESGVTLLEWVRKQGIEAEVIILTGYGQLESAMKAVECGAFAYMEKPFDNAAMMDTVDKAVAKRQESMRHRRMEELALEANRFETLGRFVSGMLHDLSTPLSVVSSYIELIMMDPSQEGLDHKLEVMHDQTRHCADVVRSAMNFLREQRSERSAVDLNQVVESCLRVTAPVLVKQSVEVTRELDESAPNVEADFVLVRQAVLNLLNNAVQAMEGQDPPKALKVTTWRDGDGVAISVADTGPGIPATVQERIFDTFYTTKGQKGTGLGLAVVWNIMQRHGGMAEVQGSPGEGARFILRFPPDNGHE
jgi:signal transduction histidine kinase